MITVAKAMELSLRDPDRAYMPGSGYRPAPDPVPICHDTEQIDALLIPQPKAKTMNHDLTDRHRRRWSPELGQVITSRTETRFTDEQGVRRIWQTTRTRTGLLRRETIDPAWTSEVAR